MKNHSGIRRLTLLVLALAILFSTQAFIRAEETDDEQGFWGKVWGIVKYVPVQIYNGGKKAVKAYIDWGSGATPAPTSTPAPTPVPTPDPNIRPSYVPEIPEFYKDTVFRPDDPEVINAWVSHSSFPVKQ